MSGVIEEIKREQRFLELNEDKNHNIEKPSDIGKAVLRAKLTDPNSCINVSENTREKRNQKAKAEAGESLSSRLTKAT